MAASGRVRWRRFAFLVSVLVLAPVGVAHLALNAVPVTSAGVAEEAIEFPTRLTAGAAEVGLVEVGGAEYYEIAGASAAVTANGGPVAGVSVDFRIGGHTICGGVTTGGDGRATCTARVPVGALPHPLPDSYIAAFGGAGSLQPSSGAGQLIGPVGFDGP